MLSVFVVLCGKQVKSPVVIFQTIMSDNGQLFHTGNPPVYLASVLPFPVIHVREMLPMYMYS